MSLEKQQQMLIDAEARRVAIGPVSDTVPGGLTLEQAHAICEANIQKRLDAGEWLVGYKVGFTNLAVRDKMGLPDSTYGYLLDSMLRFNGGTLAMDELIAPKIECEICFRLGQDLTGPGLTIEQVLAATDRVSAAFEVCDARIKDWKCPYPDFLADNGFSARVVLPGDWRPVSSVDLLGEVVTLKQDGAAIAQGVGEAAMGHPANAVVWLADKLALRGKSLRVGQIVMTGTLTPILPIVRGSTYEATYATLGKVVHTFR
jgi:2-keto-4-pentenoate hydratase